MKYLLAAFLVALSLGCSNPSSSWEGQGLTFKQAADAATGAWYANYHIKWPGAAIDYAPGGWAITVAFKYDAGGHQEDGRVMLVPTETWTRVMGDPDLVHQTGVTVTFEGGAQPPSEVLEQLKADIFDLSEHGVRDIVIMPGDPPASAKAYNGMCVAEQSIICFVDCIRRYGPYNIMCGLACDFNECDTPSTDEEGSSPVGK